MSNDSYQMAINKIKECNLQLEWIESRKNEHNFNYEEERERIIYELNCWKSQLEFGYANAWYLI